ncbi:protein-tyrosine phosphatase [Bacillus mesophilus]|uniref:Low molecular weight protein arginine phosphatase n=1 Tax=Bacillus mesophilus TaxID=1808955 RepID=A0A6M0Q9E3_9BACI|nr:low molecular weight protein arginine phosphatase [Bacillus mesophilus]MBM7662450.1 protein-tyrosine phosphatase [Bacillus mesophilus]NEY72923.1 low molecular weight protein arginine phosphatase [Bacillus mesophilus]
MNLLFVCTGNTCRSPMAEAIAKHLSNDIHIKSAGVYAVEGSAASIHTVEALSEQGVPINHSSQGLTKNLVDWATYIFTMTQSHKDMIVRQYPESLPKIYTIKEFAQNSQSDVMDPYGGPIEVYRQTFNELNEVVQALLKELEKNR